MLVVLYTHTKSLQYVRYNYDIHNYYVCYNYDMFWFGLPLGTKLVQT